MRSEPTGFAIAFAPESASFHSPWQRVLGYPKFKDFSPLTRRLVGIIQPTNIASNQTGRLP